MSIELIRLDAETAPPFAGMTFPVYRHLMDLQPQPRHPEQGDTKQVQPVAVAAREGDENLGLLLAEVPLQEQRTPELLSVFVKPEARNRGIATGLIGACEELFRKADLPGVQAIYMVGKPSIPALERVFEKCEWQAPVTRSVTLRFTPEQALSTPWFGRVKLRKDFEIFPWEQVTDEEKEALRRSNDEKTWVKPGLEAWRHDRAGYDHVSSLGLRYKGDIVGWVINHRVSDEVVRFTCSYMGYGLGRRGRIMPLYTESIRRLQDAGTRECMFITPVGYQTMVDFVKKRCAPWATFFSETRGATKELHPAG